MNLSKNMKPMKIIEIQTLMKKSKKWVKRRSKKVNINFLKNLKLAFLTLTNITR